MDPAIWEALKPAEERLTIAGREIVVRELTAADEVGDLTKDPDAAYRLIVLCTFDTGGKPLFTLEDIPALKAARRGPVAELSAAVNRLILGEPSAPADKGAA